MRVLRCASTAAAIAILAQGRRILLRLIVCKQSHSKVVVEALSINHEVKSDAVDAREINPTLAEIHMPCAIRRVIDELGE